MLAAIGDVRRDGMDPLERVEDPDRGAGAWIRRRLDLEGTVVAPAQAIDGKRRAIENRSNSRARDSVKSLHGPGHPPAGYTTRPLTFTGRTLTVNFEESVKGYVANPSLLRAELLDASGNPLPGFGAADADPITASGLRHAASWRGKTDVGAFAGRPIRIRFYIQSGKLFAFQFV
jgi:hypothetical protein